ncbi:MAG: peptidylprolyl isomerase, partial [Bacteroidales bacterium]|nr:peptidylprolyl isomerase [Bacteroidales bacterium]
AMVGQAGSQEKLLQHLGKSMLEIKKDLYRDMEEMILMQKMREDIVKDVTITPEEVKKFYKSIPKDSLPRVDSKIEINQIVLYPESNEDAVYQVRKKLLEIREKIIGGANFATQAVLYSEGPTATRGGDRGWTGKSDMDPVYAKAAFALKEGQVSKIVETDKGFNIIQLIEREDERIHTRHILMKPKTSLEEKTAAMEKLDSVIDLVYKDSLTFEEAATRFSMDEKTFLNGGQMVNEYTMETTFDINQFESREYYILRNLSVGQISEPFESVDENGKMVFKVFMLKSRTEPHVANLKDDFDMLKQYAVAEKQEREFKKWISEKLKSTYVVIEEPYNDCDFKIQGWVK